MCEIIITHFLNRNQKLNNTILSSLATNMVSLFPRTERKTTYYVSPVPKRKSLLNKPEVANGKLVDKHRDKLTALKRAEQFESEAVTLERGRDEDKLQFSVLYD